MSLDPQKAEELWKHVKGRHYQGLIYGIPTFGMVSINFSFNIATHVPPIFSNVGYHSVVGKPVDIARNEIAMSALKNGQGFVFFRDDDVIAPRETISKLIKRFPVKEKTDPYNEGSMIVGGIVYSKQQPPVPMVHRAGHTAGFEDWEVNDLVDCDAIGMGCTMIPVGVFKRTLEAVKFWRCANTACATKWTVDYEKSGNCPTCGLELLPDWFRTVRDYADDGSPAIFTEDAYFCDKCLKVGVKVYADAGVQCEHEAFDPDPAKTTYYYYHAGVGPAWRQANIVYFYPDAKNEVHERMALKPRPNGKKNGKVRFNLGSGGASKKGFVNVDLQDPCDFKCDVRDISPLVRHYGQADEIVASHILEHIPRFECLKTVRSWLKGLKSGGVLRIECPDGVWACENFVEKSKNGGPPDDFPDMIVMGRQAWPGDEHKTLLYEKRLHEIARACKNQIKSYKVTTAFPKHYNQQVLRMRIVKK